MPQPVLALNPTRTARTTSQPWVAAGSDDDDLTISDALADHPIFRQLTWKQSLQGSVLNTENVLSEKANHEAIMISPDDKECWSRQNR